MILSALQPEPGWLGTWSPGFNDPTLSGWAITVSYLFVGMRCATLARRRGPPPVATVAVVRGARQVQVAAPGGMHNVERFLWRAVSWLLFALGINKQLDLQTALREVGRLLVSSLELGSLRILVQLLFLCVLGLVLLGLAWLAWRIARHTPGAVRLALWGVSGLLAFVLLRAVQFENKGSQASMAAQLISLCAELIGSGVIAYAATRRQRELQRAR